MWKQNDDVSRRAWNIVRLALLWARKGGVFKRRLMMELRVVPKFIKNLGNANQSDNIHYGERQLSFDETPIFHVKMHRPNSMRFHLPHIPCFTTPQVDFDYDFDGRDDADDNDGAYSQMYYDSGRKSFLKVTAGDDEEGDEMASYGEESIDMRAEEFIAKFYEQMKLQRQISYLQYNEMLNRGSS
ncbi:uncharacterized protein LOC107426364 [Ziziphus jujuba]|uniref:Uncharacterized protein LOC107426364 n=2 Tax=Ziziphus jujuba TaxID=326968 RepID=A0A6P4AS72_ZIZJJ|nr:uncharacterized protein LOC107426364 [Ziziphus jujuba]KAH7516998.1 hypothetical protein FEM48_Zijuj09G0015400 [Ziziphus jujuba var. spinosa]